MTRWLFALFMPMLMIMGLASCADRLPTTPSDATSFGDDPEIDLSWDPSGWQLAMIREAKYALSRRADGSSGVLLYKGGTFFGGDWDYVNDAGGASALAEVKNHFDSSEYGRYGFWREDALTKSCVNVGHGGYCKFFADLVQWRATGGQKGHLPSNTSASGSVSRVEPGDIIQIPAYYGHTAIVIEILARDGSGNVTAVDVIDSNYTGGDGRYIISRHPISGDALKNYRTYH